MPRRAFHRQKNPQSYDNDWLTTVVFHDRFFALRSSVNMPPGNTRRLRLFFTLILSQNIFGKIYSITLPQTFYVLNITLLPSTKKTLKPLNYKQSIKKIIWITCRLFNSSPGEKTSFLTFNFHGTLNIKIDITENILIQNQLCQVMKQQ